MPDSQIWFDMEQKPSAEMIEFLNSAQANKKKKLMLVITARQELLEGNDQLDFIKPAIKFGEAKVRTLPPLLYSTSDKSNYQRWYLTQPRLNKGRRG